jgi:Domain of unknown function DUF11
MNAFKKTTWTIAACIVSLVSFTKAEVEGLKGNSASAVTKVVEVSQKMSVTETGEIYSSEPVIANKLFKSPQDLWATHAIPRNEQKRFLEKTRVDSLPNFSPYTTEVTLAFPELITEGKTGIGYIKISQPVKKALKFQMVARYRKELSLPKSVTIPAGKTIAYFKIRTRNDKLTNLIHLSDMAIYIREKILIIGQVPILDDETPPTVTFTGPSSLSERGVVASNNSVITLDRPLDVNASIFVSSDSEVSFNGIDNLFLARGKTRIEFALGAKDNYGIDENRLVDAIAYLNGVKLAKTPILIIDDEPHDLALELPKSVPEGGEAIGKIIISRPTGFGFDVNLTNNKDDQIKIPKIVKIPAGASEVSFKISGLDNLSRDGTRLVSIDATANSFSNASGIMKILDNEVVAYRIGGFGDIVNVNAPVSAEVFATDIEGNDILNYNGMVNLVLALPNGSTQPIQSSAVNIDGANGWKGNLSVPNLSSTPLQIRVSDATGNTGQTLPFDLMRRLPLIGKNMVWDNVRGRIYVGGVKSAGIATGEQLIAINPENLQLTNTGNAGSNSLDLIMSSEGKYLYQSSGSDGCIYKIKPDTLETLSKFPLAIYQNVRSYSTDLCSIKGSPDSIAAVLKDYPSNNRYFDQISHGVVIFDGGVIRPSMVSGSTNIDNIEPSSDISIFYGTGRYGLSRLKLTEHGFETLTTKNVYGLYYGKTINSYSDNIFSVTGSVIDGKRMKGIGNLHTNPVYSFTDSGLIFPDPTSARMFYLEKNSREIRQYQNADVYSSITAYQPDTLNVIHRLELPIYESEASELIRWGQNGIAYLTPNELVLINSNRLVPNSPAADLAISVEPPANPVAIGVATTYRVSVTNYGPNIAKNIQLNALLSDGQLLQQAVSRSGLPVRSVSSVTLSLGDIAVNASSTMDVIVVPQIPGQIWCTGSVVTNSFDPVVSNNSAEGVVKVLYEAGDEVFKPFKLDSNNLTYDTTRGVFWASLDYDAAGPIGNAIVSFDPSNGNVSEPINLSQRPIEGSMAISGNGRYLYYGNYYGVERIDLESNPKVSVSIPLSNPESWGYYPARAYQIRVLDGDGTNIVVSAAPVYGSFRVNILVDDLLVKNIFSFEEGSGSNQPTSKPNVFLSYSQYLSRNKLYEFTLSPIGVTTRELPDLINGYKVHGDGKFLLSSSGRLVDSDMISLISDLGMVGSPCVDATNQRAYLVNGKLVHVYSASTGVQTGTITIPTESMGDWAQSCLRWGTDGLAILGKGEIFLARSTLVTSRPNR